jgi:hypothetical protein
VHESFVITSQPGVLRDNSKKRSAPGRAALRAWAAARYREERRRLAF